MHGESGQRVEQHDDILSGLQHPLAAVDGQNAEFDVPIDVLII